METFVGEIGEHSWRGHAGIVDQDVQHSFGEPGGTCCCRFRGRTVSHIERDALRLTAAGANAFGNSRSGAGVHVTDQYRCAGGGQRVGDGGADPTTGSRDQCRATGQIEG